MSQPPEYRVSGQPALLVRLIAVAAVIAVLIAGFLCLSHVTADRVATGLIAAGVALACLIVI